MTLIVFKKDTVAVDTLLTDTKTGFLSHGSKAVEKPIGWQLGVRLGNQRHAQALMDWVVEGAKRKDWPGHTYKLANSAVIMFSNESIYEYGHDDPWPEIIEYRDIEDGWALGSGDEFAMGLMIARPKWGAYRVALETASYYEGVGDEIETFKIRRKK